MYKKLRQAWPFLLPGLAGLLIFYGIPFVGGVWFSVTDGTVKNSFVGIDNYVTVWNNVMFQLGLRNTMELSLISILFQSSEKRRLSVVRDDPGPT